MPWLGLARFGTTPSRTHHWSNVRFFPGQWNQLTNGLRTFYFIWGVPLRHSASIYKMLRSREHLFTNDPPHCVLLRVHGARMSKIVCCLTCVLQCTPNPTVLFNTSLLRFCCKCVELPVSRNKRRSVCPVQAFRKRVGHIKYVGSRLLYRTFSPVKISLALSNS